MEFISEIRGKMTYLVVGGVFIGAVVSWIWEFSVFETLFDAWWLDAIVALVVFFVGVYVLGCYIGKICSVIKEELGTLGEVNTRQSERT